jgi:hypothetical protein
MPILTFVSEAGRNKHKQRLVLVQCSCGTPAFICREDSYKQEHTTSCGCMRNGKQATKVAAKNEQQKPEPIVESNFERGSVAWMTDEIARKEADLIAAENRARFLEHERKQQTTTDLDTHKRWTVETATVFKLEQQIARLKIQKAKAETATVKSTKSPAELKKEKLAAMKGKQ